LVAVRTAFAPICFAEWNPLCRCETVL